MSIYTGTLITIALMIFASLATGVLVSLVKDINFLRELQEARERIPESVKPLLNIAVPLLADYTPHAKRAGVAGLNSVIAEIERRYKSTSTPLDDVPGEYLVKSLEDMVKRLERIETLQAEAAKLTQVSPESDIVSAIEQNVFRASAGKPIE